MRVEELMPLVAAGKVAICANKNHKCLDPQGWAPCSGPNQCQSRSIQGLERL